MDIDTEGENERSNQLILFGRDVTKIPCFRNSMLYGIYAGVGLGLVTFLVTSRSRRSMEVALGSYMGTTLAYWSYCRYDHVKQKYAINDLKMLLQQKSVTVQETEVSGAKSAEQKGKLVDA